MKKLFTFLFVSLFPCALAAQELPQVPTFAADDFLTQNQVIINGKQTCQATRVHRNWYLTAAHCVTSCHEKDCDLKVLVAVGAVTAFVKVRSKDVYAPWKKYKENKGKVQVSSDVALMYFDPDQVSFEYGNGSLPGVPVDEKSFLAATKQEPNLRAQWRAFWNPEYPEIHTHTGENLMKLTHAIVVPRWNFGDLSYLDSYETGAAVYMGNMDAVWASAGFGVEPGNSGGGVYLGDNLGLVGVVSARRKNTFPAEVTAVIPELDNTNEFFMFTGFSKETYKFIRKTLQQKGDSLPSSQVKRLQRKKPVQLSEGV